jgi:tripartite-type tricarboxylate transporter receptor subunit TctC
MLCIVPKSFAQRGFRKLATAGIVAALAMPVLCSVPSSQHAWTQTPKTIKLVVPVAPGGVGDFLARVLAEQIRRLQGMTIVVENRAGAGGAIAAEAVSRAPPDGNTVLMAAPDLLISAQLRKLNFNFLTSFEPICDLVSYPAILAVNSTSPYRTLAEFVSDARAKPGNLSLASFGPATVFQIAFEQFKRTSKVDMTFVPYPGSGPAVNALLGGHVSSVLVSYSAVAEHINAGRLRAIATGTRTRLEALPDVPTIAESGYPD